MAVMISEENQSTEVHLLNEMIERLISINWYSQAGKQYVEAAEKTVQFIESLGVSRYEVRAVSKEEIPNIIQRLTFNGSELWTVLNEEPDRLKEKIVLSGKEELLQKVVDIVPEAVFHPAFAGAHQTFKDLKTVQFLIGHAMYISVMSCAAVLAGEEELFEPILNIIEAGHIPLGPEGDIFYVA